MDKLNLVRLNLYSLNNNLEELRNTEHFKGWIFNNKSTKELNLTHNLIAPKAGFTELMNIYDKDPIIQLKKAIYQLKLKR